MRVSKYNIVTTALVVIFLGIFVGIMRCDRIKYLKKGEIVADGKIYDSLVAIANRPPVIRIDTIPGDTPAPKIIYKDKLVPIYLDSLSAVYSDTLYGDHFNAVINDTLQFNRIVSREYAYEEYIDTIVKYIEKEKPVFVDKLIPVPKKGFYGGVSLYLNKNVTLLSGDILFINKKDFYYGVSGGVTSYYCNGPQRNPVVGLKFGKKF